MATSTTWATNRTDYQFCKIYFIIVKTRSFPFIPLFRDLLRTSTRKSFDWIFFTYSQAIGTPATGFILLFSPKTLARGYFCWRRLNPLPIEEPGCMCWHKYILPRRVCMLKKETSTYFVSSLFTFLEWCSNSVAFSYVKNFFYKSKHSKKRDLTPHHSVTYPGEWSVPLKHGFSPLFNFLHPQALL